MVFHIILDAKEKPVLILFDIGLILDDEVWEFQIPILIGEFSFVDGVFENLGLIFDFIDAVIDEFLFLPLGIQGDIAHLGVEIFLAIGCDKGFVKIPTGKPVADFARRGKLWDIVGRVDKITDRLIQIIGTEGDFELLVPIILDDKIDGI